MSVQSYLFFKGRADEAITFYGKSLDAEVLMRMTYGDGPDGSCPDGSTPPADKVMHASLRIGGTELGLSDGEERGQIHFHVLMSGAGPQGRPKICFQWRQKRHRCHPRRL